MPLTKTNGKRTPEHRDEAFSQLVKTTRTLCDYAKTKQMMVELEIFDYDVDKASQIRVSGKRQ